jgi:hypothetical protein
MKKGINIWSFPAGSVRENLTLAKNAGFEGVELALDRAGEISLTSTEKELLDIRATAEELGLSLYSLSCGLCWELRLSDDDSTVREKAKDMIKKQIDTANAVNRADDKVREAYRQSKDGIVVLPCYLPWKNGLYRSEALFVVYPSQRGGWSAQCVPDRKTKRSKLPFPQSWAGQPPEVIAQKSGMQGITFCHASRFLISTDTRETAIAACRQVLRNNGRIK